MNHLNKIGKMISDHKKITRDIENLIHSKDKVISMYTSETDIYKYTLYQDKLLLGDLDELIQNIKGLKKEPDEALDEYYNELSIPASQFKKVDLAYCTFSFKEGTEPEPWEDWYNDVIYVTLSGEVPWSEEEQQEERNKIDEKLKKLNNDLFELETQMKGVSLL